MCCMLGNRMIIVSGGVYTHDLAEFPMVPLASCGLIISLEVIHVIDDLLLVTVVSPSLRNRCSHGPS